MAKRIPLRNRVGEVIAYALVDAADYDRVLAAGPWHLHHGYARHTVNTRQHVYMHRVVLNLPPGRVPATDHRNRDRLDNRRANLRAGSYATNAQNVPSRGGYSDHRGVTWDKRSGRWMAQAGLNGKKHHMGYYDREEEAARAAAEWRRANMPYATD